VPTRTTRRVWAQRAAGALFGAYVLSVFLPGRPMPMPLIHEWVPVVVPLVCAAIIARQAARSDVGKMTWWLFAAGTLSWGIGDAIFSILDMMGAAPATTLTWADAFYLALVPLWAAALVVHPRRAGRGLERVGGTLDMLAVIVGAGGVAWAFVVQPLASGSDGLTSVVAAVVYPVGDLALLTAFGALVLRTRMNVRRSDLMIGAGALLFAIGDLVYARLVLTDSYAVGSPVDLVFEAGFIVIAVASLLPTESRNEQTTETPIAAYTGLIAIAGLIGIVASALVTHQRVIAGAAMVMGIIIAIRQTLLLADRRSLIVALELARGEAEQASTAKTEFLSHMSHEFGTPLASILGYAQLLEEQKQDEEVRLYSQRIENAANHLHDIVKEALDISRIEQGRLGMSLEPIALLELVNDCLDVVRPIADSANIRMSIDTNAYVDAFVLADHQRLKQVLINLLSNAIKYNREGGRVLVTWSRLPDGMRRISVADTGVGIAPEARDRLFKPFERLGGRKSVKGTGLGLALTKRMTEAMGGRIGVQSAVGEGSTFWVDFPYAASLRRPDQSPPRRTTDAPRTILYIEDNVSNVKLVEEIMRGRGTKILAAMQGGLGFDLARQHHPDVILLDRHLPDAPADAVLARLKAEPATRDIPVVVLSAQAADEEFEPLLAAGALAYLTKPIDVARFIGLMDNLLARSAA
jgi:signal transduction histidine kinase/CheY-like chemotaxis protein